MRRREFITLIGGAAAWPLEAHGQQAGRRYRIAVLGAPLPPSFFDDLGQAGFVKGGNVEFDGRGIGVASASYATVTAELTQARPDVLIAGGSEAATCGTESNTTHSHRGARGRPAWQ
jgi:putative tryptophan/tyrosine transport system substrate-binding protein